MNNVFRYLIIASRSGGGSECEQSYPYRARVR